MGKTNKNKQDWVGPHSSSKKCFNFDHTGLQTKITQWIKKFRGLKNFESQKFFFRTFFVLMSPNIQSFGQRNFLIWELWSLKHLLCVPKHLFPKLILQLLLLNLSWHDLYWLDLYLYNIPSLLDLTKIDLTRLALPWH